MIQAEAEHCFLQASMCSMTSDGPAEEHIAGSGTHSNSLGTPDSWRGAVDLLHFACDCIDFNPSSLHHHIIASSLLWRALQTVCVVDEQWSNCVSDEREKLAGDATRKC